MESKSNLPQGCLPADRGILIFNAIATPLNSYQLTAIS
jgi:hypothetical protein